MLPHVPTLTLATLAVSAILSLLMFCTWLQDRDERALLYWGPAGLAGAAGMMILVSDTTLLPAGSVVVSHVLFILWAGLTWCGARCFGGRRPHLEWVVGAALAWIALSQTDLIANNLAARVSLISIVRAVFTALAMYELWRGRDERLLSRWAALGALGIHTVALFMRVPVVAFLDLPPQPEIFQTGWFGATAMGQLLYTTAITFVLLAMAKERAELRHKLAARTDSLTSLLNRRAFIEEGVVCTIRAAALGIPVAALVFDLDRFKSINDRFGHAAGDRVLKRFAATLRSELHRMDLAGRMGGEEFATLLPGCDQRVALVIADRIREAFAAGGAIEDVEIAATVSVGVAVATRPQELAVLLAEADRAVYLAKRAGRNCVRLAGAASLEDPHADTPVPSVAA